MEEWAAAVLRICASTWWCDPVTGACLLREILCKFTPPRTFIQVSSFCQAHPVTHTGVRQLQNCIPSGRKQPGCQTTRSKSVSPLPWPKLHLCTSSVATSALLPGFSSFPSDSCPAKDDVVAHDNCCGRSPVLPMGEDLPGETSEPMRRSRVWRK